MRIALITSSLGPGGAERVMSIMANYWAAHDWDITLITLSSDSGDWYELHPKVKRIGLNLLSNSKHVGEAMRYNLQRVRGLRRELRRLRLQAVISFVDEPNVLTLMASIGLGIPVIVSERIDPRHYTVGAAWNVLRSLLYRRADALVVQSNALRNWAHSFVREGNVHVIPNPVNPRLNGSKYHSISRGSGLTVAAMGRLTRQKGFDLLLRAFHLAAKKHDGWSLIILGEGEERPSLEALTNELGLSRRVSMPGLVQESGRILNGVDLFVLSSQYEGFPNALLEAMACGVAVISTDCNSGPREIIRDGVDGVLVPPDNVEALASAMDRLMANQPERQRLGARAVEVTERFSIGTIMKKWEDLLMQTSRYQIHE